jgi:hypothetical protein
VPPPTRSGNSLQVRDRIVDQLDQRTLFRKLVEYPNRIQQSNLPMLFLLPPRYV